MDDFGNIIYVVIAIGWFFWNAYKKSQAGKSDSKADPVSGSGNTGNEEKGTLESLEDFILEQLGEQKEPEPVVAKAEPKLSRSDNQDKFLNLDRTHEHLKDDYVMSEGESGSHRVQRQVSRLKVQEIEEKENLMEELFPNEGFDLRKAVVLNAILERPYK